MDSQSWKATSCWATPIVWRGRRLASLVDGQMRQLAQGMNTTTPSRLAVLTALNLAHQLFEAEKKRAQGEADVERRMTSLMESIEEQVPTSLFR